MANRYLSLQFVCILLLTVFVAVSITTNDRLLTGDNVVYFLKDMKATFQAQSQPYEQTLVYMEDEDNTFATYRNGLVVLGESKLTVFTATGRESYAVWHTLHSPKLVSASKYFAAYSVGANEVYLGNSFHIVKELKTDASVRAVALGDNGYTMIITDGTATQSEAILYNGDHTKMNRIQLHEYTVCGALASDGTSAALCSVFDQNGILSTKISYFEPGSSAMGREITVEDAYPVSCRYASDGGLLLLTLQAVYRFSPDGSQIAKAAFDGDHVVCFAESENGYAVLEKSTSADAKSPCFRALLFDNSGSLWYTVSIDSQVKQIAWAGDVLYALCADSLLTIDPATGTVQNAVGNDSYQKIAVCEDGSVILCKAAKAILLE